MIYTDGRGGWESVQRRTSWTSGRAMNEQMSERASKISITAMSSTCISVYIFCTTFGWFSIEFSIFAHWLSCATTCIDLSFMHMHVKTSAQLSKVQTAFVFIRFEGICRCNSLRSFVFVYSQNTRNSLCPRLCRPYVPAFKIGIGISFIHKCEKQLKFEILRSSGKVFSIRYAIIKKAFEQKKKWRVAGSRSAGKRG